MLSLNVTFFGGVLTVLTPGTPLSLPTSVANDESSVPHV